MGPVRMISSGHELTTDYDEKTLHELGFKDMQVRFHHKSSLPPTGVPSKCIPNKSVQNLKKEQQY